MSRIQAQRKTCIAVKIRQFLMASRVPKLRAALLHHARHFRPRRQHQRRRARDVDGEASATECKRVKQRVGGCKVSAEARNCRVEADRHGAPGRAGPDCDGRYGCRCRLQQGYSPRRPGAAQGQLRSPGNVGEHRIPAKRSGRKRPSTRQGDGDTRVGNADLGGERRCRGKRQSCGNGGLHGVATGPACRLWPAVRQARRASRRRRRPLPSARLSPCP